MKKYSDVWNGIENKTINGGKENDYEKTYMKIKFSSDDDLQLDKPLKFHNMTITMRSVFEEDGKIYPQVFLDDTLYKLSTLNVNCKQCIKILEYNKIDIWEGIDVNKTNLSKECDICHHWYLKDINFKYEPYLCNGCHGLMQKAMSFNNFAIVYGKGSAYGINFWMILKSLNTSI